MSPHPANKKFENATRRALSVSLLLLVSFVVVGFLAELTGAQGLMRDLIDLATNASFLLLCATSLVLFTIREWALLAVAFILSILLVQLPNSGAIFSDALGLAAFFAVFIAMLTIMKEAAKRSQSVVEVGVYLTSQPPGRRFYSVAFGSHILGAFLNFSAVSLIAPLIQKGAQASAGAKNSDLERRQLSALIRGFSWILLWAPTTLTQAVLLQMFTEINYVLLLGLGFGSAILMIAVGRIFDRVEWPAPKIQPNGGQLEPPRQSLRVVFFVCGALLTFTYFGKFLTGFSIAETLIIVAPLITIIWLFAQKSAARRYYGGSHAGESIASILDAAAPDLARSAIVLGLSGFIGRVSVNIFPTTEIALWLESSNISGWVFLSILPIIITLGGQIALSPIVFVVFLGGVLTGLPTLPADPTHIVFALSVGWALSMTASPNATATLLISATCNIAPTTLTWKWNSRYALVCYLIFSGIFYLIEL